MVNVLKIVSDGMKELGYRYAFARWNGKVVYPYFVGDYQEVESMTEDGMTEATFTLTGYTTKSWLELEEAKEKIEKYFNRISGKIVTAEGSAVAIFYASSLVVPTGDAELKKIQINLQVKEWKVI